MKQFLKFLLAIQLFAFGVGLSYSNDLQQIIRFPLQDSTRTNYCQSQPLVINEEIYLFYSANNSPQDTIFLTKSSDSGQNWSTPIYVSELSREENEMLFISSTISNTGRMFVIFSMGESLTNNKTKIVHSDDSGLIWSLPANIIGIVFIPYPKIINTPDHRLWIVGRNNNFFFSVDDGNTWAAKNVGFSTSYSTSFDLIAIDSTNYLIAYDKFDSFTNSYKLYSRKSTDAGNSWLAESMITQSNRSERRPCLSKASDSTLWLISESFDSTSFSATYDIYQQNICYKKSSNNGDSWSTTSNFTSYLGFDGNPNISNYNDKPLITFLSDRVYGQNQIWMGQIEVTQDDMEQPVLYKSENTILNVDVPISIKSFVGSNTGIQKVDLFYEMNKTLYGPIQMFDDGNHNDGLIGDNIFGTSIGPFTYYNEVKTKFTITDNSSNIATYIGMTLKFPQPPIRNLWMSAGQLHNWYSSLGCEIEEGFVANQQYGMEWPAQYRNQDMQASRGWWIGCKDFTDEKGDFYPYKVVAVGPRNPAFFAAYPIKTEMVGKFQPTIVKVDGIASQDKVISIDQFDDTMPWDRMIINKVATQLGVTMERKMFQFSQQYNDSYIVYDYTFTNTGNTDGDTTTIELPNNTIHDLYTFWTYRNAVNASVRYVIGNQTGWGINTMNDARGDGVKVDPVGEQFRCQFSWHGYTTDKDVSYDNIGGPIWTLTSTALSWNVKSDTVGRLGGSQFLGVVTLHADKSTTDRSDDINQPSTTSYLDSDGSFYYAGADAYNLNDMTNKYQAMISGHKSPRHADAVEPSGDFAKQTTNPNLGNSGGFSFNNGFGPYTLGPGESVHIVMAEVAASMSREDQIKYGKQFKAGILSAYDKNTYVINEGRDSLFHTFQNAMENYNSGWSIPLPPRPPVTFDINSGDDGILLNWTTDPADSNSQKGFRIYRATNFYDADYTLIAELIPNIHSYKDTNTFADIDYFYYLTIIGPEQAGGPGTPSGRLESSRFYTQTYSPVHSSITSVLDKNFTVLDYKLLQNYPNPFNPSSKISYSIAESGRVLLQVYDVLGREIANLVNEEKPAGKYEVIFNVNDLASGIYFYRLQSGKFVETKKMILLK